MAKCGKKSKAKRVTIKKKHKVLKKVKEHHKKKAKEANKHAAVAVNRKAKVDKDRGTPDDRIPYEEQKDFNAHQPPRPPAAAHQIREQKPSLKETARKRKLGLLEDVEISGAADDGEPKAKMGKSRDNSDRAFYQELVKVIEASDVILEVLDARDPLGTRCADLEKLVMRAGSGKRLVLILNKIDLVPRESIEKWLKYLREELPAIAFKCNAQEQRSNLKGKSHIKLSKQNNIPLLSSDCLGADTLLKLLKNYSRSHEIKMSITVGVIGLPNVGKSSLINSLKRSHAVNVGSTPGLTRSMQEVQLDKNVKLLDCPGVVMLKSSENDASIALRNCKRIEKLEDPVGPVKQILESKLCPASTLVTLYKIPSFDSVDVFLQGVATVRGKLKKGGVLDIESAARIVLHDWNEGKIPYYTMPPTRNQGELVETRIVSVFEKEFNIDEAYRSETTYIGSLKSVDGFHDVENFPSCPLNFDENMQEGDMMPQPASQCSEKAIGTSLGDLPRGGDIPMQCEGDTKKVKVRSERWRENNKLYAAEGMLQIKKKKASRKRRLKAKKLLAARDAMVGDYDDPKMDHNLSGSDMDGVDGDSDEMVDTNEDDGVGAGINGDSVVSRYAALELDVAE